MIIGGYSRIAFTYWVVHNMIIKRIRFVMLSVITIFRNKTRPEGYNNDGTWIGIVVDRKFGIGKTTYYLFPVFGNQYFVHSILITDSYMDILNRKSCRSVVFLLLKSLFLPATLERLRHTWNSIETSSTDYLVAERNTHGVSGFLKTFRITIKLKN